MSGFLLESATVDSVLVEAISVYGCWPAHRVHELAEAGVEVVRVKKSAQVHNLAFVNVLVRLEAFRLFGELVLRVHAEICWTDHSKQSGKQSALEVALVVVSLTMAVAAGRAVSLLVEVASGSPDEAVFS